MNEMSQPIQCLVCQRELVPIWREGAASAGRCPQCGLIFSFGAEPMHFEEDYFRRSVTQPDVQRIRMDHFRWLIAALPIPLTPPLLDVGAGVGFFWRALPPDLAQNAVLVEPSAFARGVLQEQTSARIFASPADIPPALAATFATVTLWDVLAHVHDPIGLLQQIRALMAEDGRLIIKTPHHPQRLFMLARLLKPVGKGRSLLHIPSMTLHFTPDNIQPLLAASGLALEHWQWTDEPPLPQAKNLATLKGMLLKAGRESVMRHDSFIVIARPV